MAKLVRGAPPRDPESRLYPGLCRPVSRHVRGPADDHRRRHPGGRLGAGLGLGGELRPDPAGSLRPLVANGRDRPHPARGAGRRAAVPSADRMDHPGPGLPQRRLHPGRLVGSARHDRLSAAAAGGQSDGGRPSGPHQPAQLPGGRGAAVDRGHDHRRPPAPGHADAEVRRRPVRPGHHRRRLASVARGPRDGGADGGPDRTQPPASGRPGPGRDRPGRRRTGQQGQVPLPRHDQP